MKLSKIFDYILIVALIYVVLTQFPTIMNSFKQQGKPLPRSNAVDLNSQPLTLPIPNKRAVYIFWATWCGPCKVQMSRFKSAVEDDDIQPSEIIAVNLNEPLDVVQRFQDENKYPFHIVLSSNKNAWEHFNVRATPSMAFVNETGEIEYFTAGISFLANQRAKSFLNKK